MQAHGMQASEVDIGQIQKSSLGIEGWSKKAIRLTGSTARDDVGQAFARAIVRPEATAKRAIYKELTNDLKAEFRGLWDLKRDWDSRLHDITFAVLGSAH